MDTQLLLQTLNQLPTPVLVVKNEEGVLKTKYLNAAFTEIIGYTVEEMPDLKSWYKLVFPRAIYRVAMKSEWFKATETALSAGENTISHIARICLKNGNFNWFDVKTTLDSDLQFIVFLDINRVNEDNQQLHSELMMKNNVISILSHDLRNPFTNVKALSDLLQSEIAVNNFENIRDYVHLIKKTSANALMMLEELLISARMENQTISLNLQPVSVRQLIEETAEKFRLDLLYKSQELEQEIHTDKLFALDKMKTGQILTNLISNAIKYSEAGKKITIGADYLNPHLVLWVEDEGQGFDAKDKAKMFGKFQTLSAQPTGGEKSIGLGLYICKAFTEQQNGRITAESKGRNTGSRFTVELPVKEV